MDTDKDICWSIKFRKQRQAKHEKKAEEKIEDRDLDTEPVATKPSRKLPNFLIKFPTKSKTKTQNNISNHPCDSLHLPKDTTSKLAAEVSQISLRLTTSKTSKKESKNSSKDSKKSCCVEGACCIKKDSKTDMCGPKPCGENDDSNDDQKCEKPKKEKPNSCDKVKKDAKKPGKCNFLPELACCADPRPKRKKVKGKKTKANSSVCVINASMKTNCCACCCLLAEYFKEILRLFCAKNDTRLSEIFCELFDVAGCICNDCLNFLKKIMNCVLSMNSKCC